jgi:hypothetical protein
LYCHKMREMNLIFHFSHGIDFYVSINLMTLGTEVCLYLERYGQAPGSSGEASCGASEWEER